MTRERTLRIIKYALLLLIVLNISFIFYQSVLPPSESKEESDSFSEILEEIIPSDTKPGKFIHKNIRKLAHFMEFFSLGALVSTYVIFFLKRIKWALISFPSVFFVAFTDETIQLFSGRGPAIFDVWIDFIGFATSSVIFYTVAIISVFIYRKCKQK